MGNEKSVFNGIDIDEKAVEITDFWIQYGATVDTSNLQRVSIFISEPSLHYTASFGKPSPLEKASKNLMLHRHPCILRYISSWTKGDKFYLTTEEVKPLIQVIENQSTLQICIGLHNILRALTFLHEKALASHNNVCSNAIYVTSEGCWKLAGLEFLCKFKAVSPSYFQKIKRYRCEKAVSPTEDISALISSTNITAIDAYAFGILAEDILRLKNAGDVPALTMFREFCKENLQNSEPALRSKISLVLRHAFFTHDFMKIYAFLGELPLKNDTEKEEFFTNLVKQLKTYPENIIGEQLGRLLLSRLVMLDCTAQAKLLPFVLSPEDENSEVRNSLFSVPTFRKYFVPEILQIFCIRDATIRLLLLAHFKSYVHIFQVNELKYHILPELMVGVKDTNDHLVCATLKALADVIPILGASAVIGGNRGKLFTDGRPNKVRPDCVIKCPLPQSELNVSENIEMLSAELPERPSPDGGEDKRDSTIAFTEEECTWSDWETQEGGNETQYAENTISSLHQSIDSMYTIAANDMTEPHSDVPNTLGLKYTKKLAISDISELDIKHSKSIKSQKEEIDFFTDMEPVIKKTQILHVEEPQLSVKSIFDVTTATTALDEEENNGGWSEDLSDLEVDSTQEV